MIEVRRTAEFTNWLDELKDRRAATRINMRLLRAASGQLGDVKSVGQGVTEMRIDYGPGYRVYFTRAGAAVVVLLCGGDKSTQDRDILKARRIAFRLGAPP